MHMMLKFSASLAALALLAAPASAFRDKKHQAWPEPLGNSHTVHVRYPGDVAYPFGTVHVRGNWKIPYVEKCHWSYQWGRGLKQTCYRYTLQDTPPRR